jgi:class 3 adenylate cyclase
VVDGFLGDGMLVFFNAPVPRADHPEDALRAALAIQDSLRDAPFGVGIGIETGMALAGDPGLGEVVDFTCLGEPVNVASRLQALAGPGEIVVGPNAWRSGAELVELRHTPTTVETHDVKGVGPLEVHRLHPSGPDVAPGRYRSQSSPMGGAEANGGRP